MAIKLAVEGKGITLTHALLALFDSQEDSWKKEVLTELVQKLQSTLLSRLHQDGEPDNVRYHLRVVTNVQLPYDTARGYAPTLFTYHEFSSRTYTVHDVMTFDWSNTLHISQVH
jgi:hypothetical protein